MSGPSGAEGSLTVRELQPGEEGRWDEFVERCPEATFFHRAGWKTVLEMGLDHSAPYLIAERDNVIEGVLPLGHIRSWLFGNSLISTPFCVYGGAIAASAEVRAALENEAERLARIKGVTSLELRHREARHPDWPGKRERYATFRKAIEPEPEANYHRIRRKQRAEIRKGVANGLYGEIDTDIDRFYSVFAESVRNLGTPVFSRRYFQTLKEVFGDACEILTILQGRRAVSGVMSFYFRDEVLPYHGGGTAEARDLRANDFMYWELMRRAAMRGVRIFDYGRSKVGTGAYDFKRHWGFEPEPLHYEYRLLRAKEVPDLSPANPKYRAFIGAWKRMPIGLSRVIGPWLARSLG